MTKDNSNCCGPTTEDRKDDTTVADETVRTQVREAYAQVALASAVDPAGGSTTGCCGVSDDPVINTLNATRLGYSQADLDQVPAGANMGLGCGNPKAIASLQPGEVVVDLGAGGGFDCFLAAHEVGTTGQVIGVDMTPEMVSKARANTNREQFPHVEFRLGEIEHLPIADQTADVVISNCVINLSTDKPQVFYEAFRVLKPGGRLAISDVVATAELPEAMRSDLALVAGCVGNAALVREYEEALADAGFTEIRIQPKDASRAFIKDWVPGLGIEDYVQSATIEAVRPKTGCC